MRECEQNRSKLECFFIPIMKLFIVTENYRSNLKVDKRWTRLSGQMVKAAADNLRFLPHLMLLGKLTQR